MRYKNKYVFVTRFDGINDNFQALEDATFAERTLSDKYGIDCFFLPVKNSYELYIYDPEELCMAKSIVEALEGIEKCN